MKASERGGSRAKREHDRLEALVSDALQSVGVTADLGALVTRVMDSLPSVEEIRPALRPALRALFGLTAACFAVAAWAMDLTQWLGAEGRAAQASLGFIAFGAAMGAGAMAVSLVRETRSRAFASLAEAARALLAGRGARHLAATVGAAVLLAAVWVFLGWFPEGFIAEGLRAARATVAFLAAVLLVAASVQVALLVRGAGSERDVKLAVKMVEAAGLAVAAMACAVNYVIFVA